MKDLSDLQNLLSKGYFPRELPPPFNTESFALHALAAGSTWKQGAWTGSVPHNLARPGGLRRPLRIPNPISYFTLAGILATNWGALKQHTWKERLSASRPHVMKNSPRSVVPRYRFGELPRLRALRRRDARYLLKTDINQFYPTLYTHTVPWALHSKTQCKALLMKPGKGSHLLGNKIDKALQCLNEGQTHGIPIGPDASLVVAEVLLAAVDAELLKRCGKAIRGFRYVDDYELSFGTLSDGESVLTELQSILAEYELALNPRKTRFEELPLPLEDTWGSELGRFTVRDASSPIGQRNDIIGLFSRAFEIASEHPEEPVLKYSVARLQNMGVSISGWRTFQNCILGAANVDASAIPVALGTLHQASSAGGHSIAKAPLADTFESIIDRHARRGEGSEVSWALWGAIAWNIPLTKEAAQLVSKMEDDVVALLALDAEVLGLFPAGSLDKQAWQSLVNQPEALVGRHWLLAYEASQKKWLTSSATVKNPAFAAMSSAGVSFYDRSKNVPQFPPAAKGNPGGSLTNYYA